LLSVDYKNNNHPTRVAVSKVHFKRSEKP